MAQKKTTKRTNKKANKSKDFEPGKMAFVIATTAVTSLTLLAALMVQ